ncbi:MAG: energy transducer TonB, partial [Myxococcota bacterium]
PKRAAKPVRTAPTPNVMTSLSGLSFDLPQFENTQFTNTDQLLGAAGANKKLVMTEETVDALPKPRNRITPEYPAKARQRGVQGHVLLKIKVSERGDVERVKVVDAEPPGVFDMVAVAAIRQWTFDPATYKGEPVAISVQQRIPFRLN